MCMIATVTAGKNLLSMLTGQLDKCLGALATDAITGTATIMVASTLLLMQGCWRHVQLMTTHKPAPLM